MITISNVVLVNQTRNENRWEHCPRYQLQVTNCSRFFVCKTEGLDGCYKAYPNEKGYQHSKVSERVKQIEVKRTQKVRSIKIAGGS